MLFGSPKFLLINIVSFSLKIKLNKIFELPWDNLCRVTLGGRKQLLLFSTGEVSQINWSGNLFIYLFSLKGLISITLF